MVAAVAAGPVVVVGEAEQPVPVEVRSAADSPVGVSTVALAASLVATAVAEAEALAVPGSAGASTGNAVLAQVGFARLDSAF